MWNALLCEATNSTEPCPASGVETQKRRTEKKRKKKGGKKPFARRHNVKAQTRQGNEEREFTQASRERERESQQQQQTFWNVLRRSPSVERYDRRRFALALR